MQGTRQARRVPLKSKERFTKNVVKLCVFDLDGTLLNTLGNIAGHMNRTLEEFSLAPYALEEYRYFVGNGARVLTERALAGRGDFDQDFFDRFYARFSAHYAAAPEAGVTVYEGILPLLDALHARGVRTAVCTNKPQAAAEGSIAEFFPAEAFSDILGGREGVPLKPAPDAVLSLLGKYGVDKSETRFIGDSDVDMLTANAVGVRGMGALWGFRTAEELSAAGAHALLSTPTDLLSYLDE